MLRQLLYKLSLEHVIRYIPADHATVIYLHHERLRPKNLNLDVDRYEQLKSSCESRMQEMIDYIQEEERCRSSFLLEYFGQTESPDCGTCDICRRNRSDRSLADSIRKYVNIERSGEYTLSDFTARYVSAEQSESENVLQLLRTMIDRQEVPAPMDWRQ